MPPKLATAPPGPNASRAQIGAWLGWTQELRTLAALPVTAQVPAARVQAFRYVHEVLANWATITNSDRADLMLYYEEFGPGRQRHGDMRSSVANSLEDEFDFRARLYRSNTEYSMPKCRICMQGNAPMPQPGQIPIGLDEDDVIACGCHYSHAMLEEFQYANGDLGDRQRNANRSCYSTVHDRTAVMELWESIFGDWDFQEMVDRQARANAIQSERNVYGDDAYP